MGTGASGKTVTATKNDSVYDVEWEDTARLQCKSTDRKAKVEIWNFNSFFGDELVGEALIYDVSPGVRIWRHCFGGALAEPRKADEALQMTRGAIKPASTYHGS